MKLCSILGGMSKNVDADPFDTVDLAVPAPARTYKRAPSRRRYDDGCAAAHALDLVGERWALLIVRELLLGPRRFSDLRHSLQGISPNVLTQRLVDLEAAGVLEPRELPPPASCRVYTLTDWGAELEPVILGLLAWGVRSPDFQRGQALTADAMALSFKAMFEPELAGRLRCHVTIIMNRHAYHIAIDQKRLAVARGDPPCAPADASGWAGATLHAEPVIVLHLAYGKRPLSQALAVEDCRVEGDTRLLERFLACFQVPASASVRNGNGRLL